MPETRARTRITEIATILVPVTDQNRSLAFYVDTLGFEKKLDYVYGSNRWIEVGPPSSSTTLALAPGGEGQHPGTNTGVRLSTDDAEADHATLTAAGVRVDEILNFGGGVPPMFVLHDPDDNRLVVVQQPLRR